jgi:hypothetical protein
LWASQVGLSGAQVTACISETPKQIESPNEYLFVASGGNSYLPTTMKRVFKKTAAGTYTFFLNGVANLDNTAQFNNIWLVATFFPVAYGAVDVH